METAVTKLEAMFQKAESDLDYIQHRMEYEIRKSLPDDSAAEENPVAVLEELAVVKSRYKMLCMKLDKISTEQQESMAAIRAAVENTMKMVQALQQHAYLEPTVFSQSLQFMAQLKSSTEHLADEHTSRTQILKEFAVVELDKPGNVELVV
ncbi:spindle and kinetochore-associated protein 2 [Pogoniulus pusillus]|uniref:spindle and kinetochore-associated protein 2 n=1 Tax=Pogoniulus pusillus TaxID=488313 RepID=UPI0030B95158